MFPPRAHAAEELLSRLVALRVWWSVERVIWQRRHTVPDTLEVPRPPIRLTTAGCEGGVNVLAMRCGSTGHSKAMTSHAHSDARQRIRVDTKRKGDGDVIMAQSGSIIRLAGMTDVVAE